MNDRQPAAITARMLATVLALTAGPALATPAASVAAQAPVNPVQAGVNAWSQGHWAAAVALWQGPAAHGDADAEFDLAQAYKLGRGTPQDLTKAEALFAKAAAKGHLQAADNYGLLLFQRGAHAQAMPYIRAAADRGDPRAQYVLGIVLFNGEGTQTDWVRAYALESLSVQAGWPPAKKALALMDGYIPLDQRQQAVQMATDLSAQAEANRSRQTAASDMHLASTDGGTVPDTESVAAAMATSAPLAAPAQAPVAAPSPPPAAPPHPRATPAPQHPATAAPRREPATASSPAETAHATSGGGWKIQLGAFGVAANAEALWAKVHARPAVTGHPRQLAQTGRVQRLLATGYSAESAAAACHALTGAGFTCLPTRD